MRGDISIRLAAAITVLSLMIARRTELRRMLMELYFVTRLAAS